jgi:hypothetical protein
MGVLGDPVRVFCAQDHRALFVVTDVLCGLGYQNLSSGVAQHLRRCPVPVEKVKLRGKRGFPHASALDSNGVQWLIDKTCPRVREVEIYEGFTEPADQAESLEIFIKSWASCLSYLPSQHPLQYPDLEAMRYTESDKEQARELQALERKITAAKIANGARSVWELSGGFGPHIICTEILRGIGPWNLQGGA